MGEKRLSFDKKFRYNKKECSEKAFFFCVKKFKSERIISLNGNLEKQAIRP
ncbi:hypothetical protein ACFVSS_16735 [Peribacillus butanolivorans]|uniref:hypothetical protein n=1 Tax=Peribacillus butanolivorans TaxID=421767 RepID=UPI0036DF711F